MKVLVFLLIFCAIPAFAQISHLELGAANYHGGNISISRKRFYVLEKTMEALIEEYGSRGVIYLADGDLRGLHEAMAHARQWLDTRGYTEVKLMEIVGDYRLKDLPRVKTAHLTNPGRNQLASSDFGMFDRRLTVKTLERVAHLSETGLEISTYFYRKKDKYLLRLKRTMRYTDLENTGREGLPYFYPNGNSAGLEFPNPQVFVLSAKGELCEKKMARLFKRSLGERWLIYRNSGEFRSLLNFLPQVLAGN